MKSQQLLSRWAILVLTASSLCACNDTPTPPAGPVSESEERALEFKPLEPRIDSTLSNEIVARMVRASHVPSQSIRDTRALAQTGESAILLQTLEDAGFATHFGSAYAYASGWMRYFGTNGKVTVNANLSFNGQQISVLPSVVEKSTLEPSVQELGTSAIAYISPNCGHRVYGTSNYRAWGSSNLPSAPTSAFMPVEDTRTSKLARQNDCPPVKKEEDVVTSGGGGGEDTRIMDDGWYLCRYEVWYDAAGNVLSRQLIGCWAL